MKKIKYIILLSLVLTYSCSDDDKLIDSIFADLERGAILRTLSSTNTYNFYDTSDNRFTFDVKVEAQGEANGAVPSIIRVYQSFKDNTEDNIDNNKSEVLINTVDATTLPTSANGFPEYTMPTLTLQDALDFSALSSGEFFGLDQFVYRFELETTDGRIFSTDLAGTVSGGSFYSSPYTYTVTIKCVPIIPFTGDYTLNLSDSYGDGWDGAFITVTIDGTATDYTFTSGGAASFTVNVPSTTTSLKFEYTSGSFEEEHSYKIIDPFGDEAATDGPAPSTGEIFLNICQ